MEKDCGGGNFLQTPEFIAFKEKDAQRKIGRYLLIAALFKNGAVVGHRFKPRQHLPHQWLIPLGSEHLIVGWSEDFASFKFLEQFVHRIRIGLKDFLTSERYVTLPAIFNKVSDYFRQKFQKDVPVPLDVLFIDVAAKRMAKIDFAGALDNYFGGFGILGGLDYQDVDSYVKDEERILKGVKLPPGTRYPPPKVAELLNDAYNKSFHYPLKDAIKHLESIYGRKILDTKEKALEAVKSALTLHDPPSKTEEFELTVFENGKLESSYFKREKKDNVSIVDLDDDEED